MEVKISILYYSSLSALNGVSTFIKTIAVGINDSKATSLSIYSLDFSGSGAELMERSVMLRAPTTTIRRAFRKTVRRVFNILSKRFTIFSFFYSYLAFNENASRIVKRKADKCRDSDIIFFQDFFTAFYYNEKFPASHNSTPKRVAVLHCDGDPLRMLFGYFPNLKDAGWTNRYFTRILIEALESLDAIVLLSELARENFNNLYPQFSIKTHVVMNGIADRNDGYCKNWIGQPSKYNLLCVGTISERKGQDLLVEALGKMDKTLLSRFNLYVVGDGPSLGLLKEKSAQHKLSNIYFEGPRNNVDEYIRAADVFILPSRDEGMPIAILEAMRAGLPIVSTKVGGIPNMVVDGYNGKLIDPSIEELARILGEIADGKIDLASLSKNSRKHYEDHFKSEVMIRNYLDIFNNVAE